MFCGPLGPARVPNSMVLELLAMTGGHLAFRHLGARRLPLLLKVPECRFEGVGASAGDRLRAVATLAGSRPVSDGTSVAETESEVFASDTPIATGDAHCSCASRRRPATFAADGARA